jgi:hypothetical protein
MLLLQQSSGFCTESASVVDSDGNVIMGIDSRICSSIWQSDRLKKTLIKGFLSVVRYLLCLLILQPIPCAMRQFSKIVPVKGFVHLLTPSNFYHQALDREKKKDARIAKLEEDTSKVNAKLEEEKRRAKFAAERERKAEHEHVSIQPSTFHCRLIREHMWSEHGGRIFSGSWVAI